MNLHCRWLRRIFLPILALTGADGRADIDWSKPLDALDWKLPDNVQIHGFASQAYIHTSDNNFFGYSQNMGSLDFTELGINGSWRPLPNLQTSLQVVYRRAGLTDDSYVRIDFGFIDYSFISDAEHQWGVRLGRVVNPYGLYNDTRDMPFTRPSILLPQSIYFDINRNTALSGDGIQLYGEERTDFGDFLLQFNGVNSRANDPAWEPVLQARSVHGELSWVGRLMYEWEGGRVRMGVTSGDLNVGYQPDMNPQILSVFPQGLPSGVTASSLSFAPILFSAQYNAETWSLTAEYALRGATVFTRASAPPYPRTAQATTGESWYVQGTYRFTPDIEGFLRYDVYHQDDGDRNGKHLQRALAAYGIPFDPSVMFAKDLAVGLRWDITSYSMFRVEYHYVDGTGWLSPNENPGETEKYWNLIAASLSFRF